MSIEPNLRLVTTTGAIPVPPNAVAYDLDALIAKLAEVEQRAAAAELLASRERSQKWASDEQRRKPHKTLTERQRQHPVSDPS